jgi:hypothetical protein
LATEAEKGNPKKLLLEIVQKIGAKDG